MYLSSFLDYEKKYKRGTYTNIKYKKKDGTYMDCVVRLGVKPKEYKSTGLSYGEWVIDKYVFYHNGKLYLRVLKKDGIRNIILDNIISIGGQKHE